MKVMKPYYETDAGIIYNGDALEALKSMEDCSVQCCITSPPYWNLRDYGTATWDGGDIECDHIDEYAKAEQKRNRKGLANNANRADGGDRKLIVQSGIDKAFQYKDICKKCGAKRIDKQLGLEPTFQEFINNLCDIFDEVKRVLKDDGTCWVVIGDTYSSKPVGTFNGGGKEFIGRNMDGIKTSGNNDKTKSGVQEKCLLQIPSRFAIEMTNRDWVLRNEIIWYKPNCMPSSANDRFTVDFEKVLFFSKNKQYKFNQQLEPYTKPINRWGGTMVKRLNGADEYGMAQRIRDYRPVKEGKNKRCVWSINTQPFPGSHFAVFPIALIEPCILAGTDNGDIILDPFFGAGTTGVAAYKHDRKFIGIELNPEYCTIAKQRIEQELSQKKLPGF